MAPIPAKPKTNRIATERNLDVILACMVSKKGLTREYTRQDIINRSGITEAEAKSALLSGTRTGMITAERIKTPGGAGNTQMQVYRLTAAGRAQAIIAANVIRSAS